MAGVERTAWAIVRYAQGGDAIMLKLTENDVRNILISFHAYGMSVRDISMEFAVSETTIRNIVKGRTRKDVKIADHHA